MPLYVECDICGEREVANGDKPSTVLPYWLTSFLVLTKEVDKETLAEKLNSSKTNVIYVCSKCDKVFNKQLQEFLKDCQKLFEVCIEEARERVMQKSCKKTEK